MALAIIRRSLGVYGEEVTKDVVRVGFQSREAAEGEIRRIIEPRSEHGYNAEHGY
jgi:hypothetical protein